MEHKYYCKWCNFKSKLKSDYQRHLKTKKHFKVSQNIAEFSPKLAEFSQNLAKISQN